jgi:urease accessory protein
MVYAFDVHGFPKDINMKTRSILSAALLLPLATVAGAHPLSETGAALGLAHPFRGLDHLFAMVAVGLWAAQMGGRSVWRVPAAFAAALLAGAFLGLAGVPLPMVETGILVSVLALGLLVAFSVRASGAAGIAIAALFAVFHGHAHGTELVAGTSAFAYVAGMTLSTVALLGAGVAAGRALAARPVTVRTAGAAITVAAVVVSGLL